MLRTVEFQCNPYFQFWIESRPEFHSEFAQDTHVGPNMEDVFFSKKSGVLGMNTWQSTDWSL